jgi:two-component system alkaline phosphatase synthesis response regulator PhoP
MTLKKVLIIDDEPLILKTTELLLKKTGIFTVLTAQNGGDGISAVKRDKPDLILLDIIMPGMDGWEVLKQLKSDTTSANIPVIVFTALDYVIADQLARQSGASGICRKPFQLHELLRTIQELENETTYD